MSAPVCAACKWGRITEHSNSDRCGHANNVEGFHPYALRNDTALCGPEAAWFEARPAPSGLYRAADAVKRT